jgi:hypothetical protein
MITKVPPTIKTFSCLDKIKKENISFIFTQSGENKLFIWVPLFDLLLLFVTKRAKTTDFEYDY